MKIAGELASLLMPNHQKYLQSFCDDYDGSMDQKTERKAESPQVFQTTKIYLVPARPAI
jgi:hypothetical protein